MKARTLIPALLITFAASGCATWDNLASREKSAATGAAVGGVALDHLGLLSPLVLSGILMLFTGLLVTTKVKVNPPA